jgi:hypothetical protein
MGEEGCDLIALEEEKFDMLPKNLTEPPPHRIRLHTYI